MAAVTATGGDVLINNVIPKHLESITAKLAEMGAVIDDLDDAIRIRSTGKVRHCNITTQPHPGFPTDMQPQAVAVLCCADGTSIITESVWDNRYRYVDQLTLLGAKVQVDGKIAIVEGVEALSPGHITATDLRAGAAMLIAALVAKGRSEIEDIFHIERGYEDIVGKLSALGADIRKVEYHAPVSSFHAQ